MYKATSNTCFFRSIPINKDWTTPNAPRPSATRIMTGYEKSEICVTLNSPRARWIHLSVNVGVRALKREKACAHCMQLYTYTCLKLYLKQQRRSGCKTGKRRKISRLKLPVEQRREERKGRSKIFRLKIQVEQRQKNTGKKERISLVGGHKCDKDVNR